MDLRRDLTRIYDEYQCAAAGRMNRLADRVRRIRIRKLLNDIDFDKRVWLRKVGLQPYSPMRASLGNGMLLLMGAIVGAFAAMMLAPGREAEFRKGMRHGPDALGASDYGDMRQPAPA
jgi:hypothetical protein